jgi:uroporphyrinogen-III synthase
METMARPQRALITRPEEDARPVADRLRALGIDAVVEPLLHIDLLDGDALDLSGVQAILITSANGVRALARRTDRRDVPVLAVGDASARQARAAGFGDVTSAGGDVDDLAALAARLCDPAAGPLLHVAGSAVAGDLAGLLERDGFITRREVLYDARRADALSDICAERIAAGQIDAVLFFSPRTAATFARLIGDVGLADRCGAMDALCLSPAVADALAALHWRRVAVAAAPTLDALLDILDEDA